MTVREQHPDKYLQRFLVLDDREKLLQRARVFLEEQRGGATLQEFLIQDMPARGSLLEVARKRLKLAEKQQKNDLQELARELALEVVGEGLGEGGIQHVEKSSLQSFKTLDDLGSLAELYESLTPSEKAWEGPRPWVGRNTKVTPE